MRQTHSILVPHTYSYIQLSSPSYKQQNNTALRNRRRSERICDLNEDTDNLLALQAGNDSSTGVTLEDALGTYHHSHTQSSNEMHTFLYTV